MAHLVRARVKRVEDLPEWAKCCEGLIQQAASYKDVDLTFDLDGARYPNGYRCEFCGNETPGNSKFVTLNNGKFASLELLDLDEGPLGGAA